MQPKPGLALLAALAACGDGGAVMTEETGSLRRAARRTLRGSQCRDDPGAPQERGRDGRRRAMQCVRASRSLPNTATRVRSTPSDTIVWAMVG
ncbi:hypothetical protein SAMN02745121_03468 [Nannocystis exedens]|uniref:Lipoprotein n=1 Tax=Nannocystis exedens TaxID=54 RepID=A0A1I1YQN6_9BACT|nr:hypothetical protein NAEX_03244 [Nannocystis exedens]SFE21846.1 hypothetical protein SAMN02745121_03468 [Nannocystis exedens]